MGLIIKAKEMFLSGKSVEEIASTLGLSIQALAYGLEKHGIQISPILLADSTGRKIVGSLRKEILDLAQQGLGPTEISKKFGITNTAIRKFLNKNGIDTKKKKVDKSRSCLMCGNLFEPKYSDGLLKNKYKFCSKPCLSKHKTKVRVKYSESDLEKIVNLKKEGKTIQEIVSLTNININKVKRTTRAVGIVVPKEEAQNRAYSAKLKANKNSMVDMRSAYHAMVRSEDALEQVKAELLEAGYEYVSGFTMRTAPFWVKCLTCLKTRETSTIHTVVKDSCMYCSGSDRTSCAEKEITEWLTSLGLRVEKYKFKTKAGGMELDIYLPELNLAIEYCGLYWHNENSPTPRDRSYHYNKMIKAKNDGITLITLFDREWDQRKNQIKNFILSKVKKNSRNIFGRKTQVKKIDIDEASIFLQNHHIQGSARIEASFGLFYKNELVAVITGAEHHRIAGTFTLNRLCFKTNTSVAGGAGKLNKTLCEWAKQNGYTKVVTWSDNRWSTGAVYSAMGYTLDAELPPDYFYVFNNKMLSKQSCKKARLAARGGVGTTEKEMANSLGYYRVWDCGKKRWVLDL